MDLLSARPFWPVRDGLPATFPPLSGNADVEVAVIGAGISGALVAVVLAEAGIDTMVLDRREAAHGSTAGNTGLVLYELDTMLHLLAERCGRERAERAYRRCRDAVVALRNLIDRHAVDCACAPARSLFLAAQRSHVPRLQRELAARQRAGLQVDWWTRGQLQATSSLPHPAALLSVDALQLDPYRLTYGLLRAAQRRGVRVHDRTAVVRSKFRRGGVELFTSRGGRVRARHVVIASGYEAGQFLPRPYGELYSTYAICSEPLTVDALAEWPGERTMMWDTAAPYLYLRLTEERRAIIGGYDERFRGPVARDRRLAGKASALQRRFRQLFPHIPFERYAAWAGTFAISADSLPFIGQHAAVPRAWFALGFGGNGITFSMVAAEVIRAALTGDADPDADLFGFDRPAANGQA